jgi:hypothetical protein
MKAASECRKYAAECRSLARAGSDERMARDRERQEAAHSAEGEAPEGFAGSNMQKQHRMTREDALALLKAFRLDQEEAPPPTSDWLARRFVHLFRLPPCFARRSIPAPDRRSSSGTAIPQ